MSEDPGWAAIDKAVTDYFAAERDGALATSWVLVVGGVDARSMDEEDGRYPIMFCTDGRSTPWAQEGLVHRAVRELIELNDSD